MTNASESKTKCGWCGGQGYLEGSVNLVPYRIPCFRCDKKAAWERELKVILLLKELRGFAPHLRPQVDETLAAISRPTEAAEAKPTALDKAERDFAEAAEDYFDKYETVERMTVGSSAYEAKVLGLINARGRAMDARQALLAAREAKS